MSEEKKRPLGPVEARAKLVDAGRNVLQAMTDYENSKEFRVEVLADSSGKWAGNGLTFSTTGEAVTYARDLASRWTLVTAWRVLNVRGEVVERQGGI